MSSEDKPAGKSDITRTVTFNTVHFDYDRNPKILGDFAGPVVDDGAPYSGSGVQKLYCLADTIIPDRTVAFALKQSPLRTLIAGNMIWLLVPVTNDSFLTLLCSVSYPNMVQKSIFVTF